MKICFNNNKEPEQEQEEQGKELKYCRYNDIQEFLNYNERED